MAFFQEKLLEHHVIAIEFDQNNKVKNVKKYGIEDVQNIAFTQEHTPTYGHDINIVEQLLGNVGKFNIEKMVK